MGFFVFTLFAIFGYLVGALADGEPVFDVGYPASIAIGPGALMAITLIVYRRWLGYIWDVNLKIRPLLRLKYDKRGMIRKVWDTLRGNN